MEIRTENLAFGYGRDLTIADLSLRFAAGECVAIVGPNGAGKSTLLKCLIAVYRARAGTVLLDGVSLHSLKPHERAKKIGYVPQASSFAFPLTVMETVLLGRRPHMQWTVRDVDLDVAAALVADLGLTPMADRYVDELSGGERQKVLLARALAQEPGILMLDEPISALDIRHQLSVLEKVRALVRRDGITAIMVLHDLELAARFSDRIVLLDAGRLHAVGAPADVLTADNIRTVYGVEVEVEPGRFGPRITAIAPVEK